WRALCRDLNTPAGVGRWSRVLPGLQDEVAAWAKGSPVAGREAVAEALGAALDPSAAAALADDLDKLAGRAGGFADAMDFRFLYNPTRHLFAIGYNVPLERLDPAHYDLLASES